VKGRLAEEQVQQGGVVRLNDEEEELFEGDEEEGGAEDGIWRVGPDAGVDQIGVPGDGGRYGDGDEEEDLVDVDWRQEGPVEEGEDQGGGDGVREVAGYETSAPAPPSVLASVLCLRRSLRVEQGEGGGRTPEHNHSPFPCYASARAPVTAVAKYGITGLRAETWRRRSYRACSGGVAREMRMLAMRRQKENV